MVKIKQSRFKDLNYRETFLILLLPFENTNYNENKCLKLESSRLHFPLGNAWTIYKLYSACTEF